MSEGILIYEPWCLCLNKSRLSIGCFETIERAEKELSDYIMKNFTSATLCDSGVRRTLFYPEPNPKRPVSVERIEGILRSYMSKTKLEDWPDRFDDITKHTAKRILAEINEGEGHGK